MYTCGQDLLIQKTLINYVNHSVIVIVLLDKISKSPKPTRPVDLKWILPPINSAQERIAKRRKVDKCRVAWIEVQQSLSQKCFGWDSHIMSHRHPFGDPVLRSGSWRIWSSWIKTCFFERTLLGNLAVCPEKASSAAGTIDPLTLQKPSSAEKCPVIVIHHPSFTINSIHHAASI